MSEQKNMRKLLETFDNFNNLEDTSIPKFEASDIDENIAPADPNYSDFKTGNEFDDFYAGVGHGVEVGNDFGGDESYDDYIPNTDNQSDLGAADGLFSKGDTVSTPDGQHGIVVDVDPAGQNIQVRFLNGEVRECSLNELQETMIGEESDYQHAQFDHGDADENSFKMYKPDVYDYKGRAERTGRNLKVVNDYGDNPLTMEVKEHHRPENLMREYQKMISEEKKKTKKKEPEKWDSKRDKKHEPKLFSKNK